MSDTEIVHTIIGRHYKYEIHQSVSFFGGRSYSMYRNGKYHRGSFDTLDKAVRAAEEESRR